RQLGLAAGSGYSLEKEVYADRTGRLLEHSPPSVALSDDLVVEHRDHRGPRNHLVQQFQPRRVRRAGEHADPGDVPARPVDAGDEAGPDRIVVVLKNDWNAPRHRPGGHRRDVAPHRDDDGATP